MWRESSERRRRGSGNLHMWINIRMQIQLSKSRVRWTKRRMRCHTNYHIIIFKLWRSHESSHAEVTYVNPAIEIQIDHSLMNVQYMESLSSSFSSWSRVLRTRSSKTLSQARSLMSRIPWRISLTRRRRASLLSWEPSIQCHWICKLQLMTDWFIYLTAPNR